MRNDEMILWWNYNETSIAVCREWWNHTMAKWQHHTILKQWNNTKTNMMKPYNVKPQISDRMIGQSLADEITHRQKYEIIQWLLLIKPVNGMDVEMIHWQNDERLQVKKNLQGKKDGSKQCHNHEMIQWLYDKAYHKADWWNHTTAKWQNYTLKDPGGHTIM